MIKILIGVTGGISAYRVADVITGLINLEYEVKVIATPDALNFVTENVLSVISNGNYITLDNKYTTHVDLAKWCDCYVICPATANTINKLSNGYADNLVTDTFLALPREKKIVLCPAMNTNMYIAQPTKKSLQYFRDEYNNTELLIIPPAYGKLACGDMGIGKLPKPRKIIDEIDNFLTQDSHWVFPLRMKYRHTTNDSYSFLDYDWKTQIEIPIYPHCGSFGIRRKHDIHKGVDLYANIEEDVCAVEDGVIVDICPFTGEHAGFPFWENTWGVYVKGNSGIVVYGEIKPYSNWKIGDVIKQGKDIGYVLPVLKKDNGRPMSMLHLELHDEAHIHTDQWELNKYTPIGVLDPTQKLIRTIKYKIVPSININN